MEETKFSISLTLSGQTTNIVIDRDHLELGEVMVAVELLLLGAGFQQNNIDNYLNLHR